MKHYALRGEKVSIKGKFLQKLLNGEPPEEIEDLRRKKGAVFSDAVLEEFIEEDYRHGRSKLYSGNRNLHTFSSGEKRKMLLDYLLKNMPDFLVLDNPFDCLDKASVEKLRETLENYSEHIPVVQLFKRKEDLLPFIDEVLVLDEENRLKVFSREEYMSMNAQNKKQNLQLEIPPPLKNYENIPEVLVDMQQVSVNYGDQAVLKDISWTVRKGEFWELTGPNGSGKTTLLDMIYGDNPKAYGADLFLFGKKKGSGESVWEIKKKIGYFSPSVSQLFKGRHSIEQMVVGGLVDSVGLYQKPSDKQLALARKWLKLLGLFGEKDRSFQDLSLLDQRLVLLGRAMIKHPPLLILDEPSTSLDDQSALLLTELINAFAAKAETAVVYVSHRKEKGLAPQFILELKPTPQGSRSELL